MKPSRPAPDSVAQQIEHSRKDLLDLSLRNSALHFRASKTRGIEIIEPPPQGICQALTLKNSRLSFQSSDEEGTPAAGDKPEDNVPEVPPTDQAKIRNLKTPYTSKMLQSRLTATFRVARSSIEEQGVNILYAALGMLHWYDSPSSKTVRAAPLTLIPVTLTRTGARRRYSLTMSEDDITTNLSLKAKLQESFGISLPVLNNGGDLKIDQYFDKVAQAVADHPEWTIDRTRVHVGFFSFTKLLLYNDLDAAVWDGHTPPADHPLIRRLFGDSTAGDEPPSPVADGQPLDEHPDLPSIREVVDADASQTTAVLDVKAGKNLVIQGPPGTGKSQSITNLIADRIAAGKTVLFIAEKRAALEVVHRRLQALGLGDACLDLHSNKASKAMVLQELERTLAIPEPRIPDRTTQEMLLTINRNRLNDYCTLINATVGRSGVTIHDTIGRLSKLNRDEKQVWPEMSLGDSGGVEWSPEEYAVRLENVQRFQSILHAMGAPAENPFHDSRLRQLTPLDVPRIGATIDAALTATRELSTTAQGLTPRRTPTTEPDKELFDTTPAQVQALTETAEQAASAPDLTGIDHRQPEWTSRLKQLRTLIRQLQELTRIHAEYDEHLKPEAWTVDLTKALAPLRSATRSIWGRATGAYRRARKAFQAIQRETGNGDELDAAAVLNAIEEHQRLTDNIEWTLGRHQALFRNQKIEDAQAREHLLRAIEWLVPLHEDLTRGAVDPRILDYLDANQHPDTLLEKVKECRHGLERLTTAYRLVQEELKITEERSSAQMARTPLTETSGWLQATKNNIERLDEHVQYNKIAAKLQENGLGRLVETAATWNEAGTRLTNAFERARLTALLQHAFDETPHLSDYRNADLTQSIRVFGENDVDQLLQNRTRVARGHWRRLPRGADNKGLALIRRECAKKRRHKPLRRLLTEAGQTIQQIKPVLMMSPLSVAKYIPPGAFLFDVLIMDEASQVRPTEALGAVLRARQIVVVGDTRQLPPTNFFDTLEDDEEHESATGDLESIMGMCKAAGFPERMLRYHYRSRHESLIAVSNQEFYNNQLAVFPSPDADRIDSGLHFHCHPETVYEPGKGKRYNAGEAAHVAEAVMEHARKTPELSLGVVGFGLSQTRHIEDEVDRRRQKSPSAESFFEKHADEPFFVKNLEQVQGDERDVILISIGYGKTAGGTMPMRFGPLNQEGGERRLNVLITRARLRLEVYANFQAIDLDTSSKQSKGLNALKVFLGYAENGILEQPAETGREPDSPFEEAVADALTARGHTVRHQIGSAGFFVDLAVVDPDHPGRYLLGIECDGKTYHSARTARDRDRLRQQVLERLGWTIHRVWSTDWFMNPGQEVDAIEKAVADARAKSPTEEAAPTPEPATPKPRPRQTKARTRTPAGTKPYRVARIPAKSEIVDAVVQVVDVESPIHVEEATRRILTKTGGTATKKRVSEVREAAELAAGTDRIRIRGDFLWNADETDVPIRRRDKPGLPAGLRKPDMLADEELQPAILHVLRQTKDIDSADAIKQTASLFGFSRAGEKWTTRLKTVVERMVTTGQVTCKDDRLSLGKVEPDQKAAEPTQDLPED